MQALSEAHTPVGSRRAPQEYFLTLRAQGAVRCNHKKDGGESPPHSLSESHNVVITGRRLRRRGNLKSFVFICLSAEQQALGLRLPRRFAPRNDVVRRFLIL